MSLVTRLELLYQRMKAAGVSALEFELGPQEKLKIALKKEGEAGKRGSGQESIAASPVPLIPVSGTPVNAPLSGVFYRSSSPSAAPFVEEGLAVKSGDVLCIIEAMKVMNEIRAPKAGKVVKVLGVNGKHVKKGDAVFLLE
ncbi:MAG: hypothetical protein HY401_04385 [Elusimicrobia bacterium]|nr:hypothetical protein [Elusimicrobiota bacterium]